MKKTNEAEYYKQGDLAMVATFCCFGFVVEHVDRSNPRRAVFYIQKSGRLKELEKLYLMKKLSVEPTRFFHMLKDLKTLLYSNA